MKFLNELIAQGGLGHRSLEVKVALLFAGVISVLLVLQFTRVLGLGLASGALALLFLVEALRAVAAKRQRNLQLAWPMVFDSMSQAASSGVLFEAQVEKLSQSAPLALRSSFSQLHRQLLEGLDSEKALLTFGENQSNRQADLFVALATLALNFGQAGQSQAWKYLANRTRQETATLGLLLAKQNWTVGTAKIALLAPWLIAALLMQLGQNKQAFESSTGSAVLLTGLLVSLFAYFLVNQLGKIKLPVRTLYATH